jgi:hypothetical protein
MAVEVGRRVAGFKEEQARMLDGRVVEEGNKKRQDPVRGKCP